MTTFYCLRFQTPLTRRARCMYLYPPGTGWPGYTPKHWVPFHRLLRLAELRWRYSTPSNWTELDWTRSVEWYSVGANHTPSNSSSTVASRSCRKDRVENIASQLVHWYLLGFCRPTTGVVKESWLSNWYTCYNIFVLLSLSFAWKHWEESRKISVGLSGVSLLIRTSHFPNISEKHTSWVVITDMFIININYLS
jgi:hypothetical protein